MFRILTEDIASPATVALAAKYFSGFTVLHGLGYWEGNQEASLVIEVITRDRDKVLMLADDIRVRNNQQVVIVQELPTLETDVDVNVSRELKVAHR